MSSNLVKHGIDLLEKRDFSAFRLPDYLNGIVIPSGYLIIGLFELFVFIFVGKMIDCGKGDVLTKNIITLMEAYCISNSVGFWSQPNTAVKYMDQTRTFPFYTSLGFFLAGSGVIQTAIFWFCMFVNRHTRSMKSFFKGLKREHRSQQQEEEARQTRITMFLNSITDRTCFLHDWKVDSIWIDIFRHVATIAFCFGALIFIGWYAQIGATPFWLIGLLQMMFSSNGNIFQEKGLLASTIFCSYSTHDSVDPYPKVPNGTLGEHINPNYEQCELGKMVYHRYGLVATGILLWTSILLNSVQLLLIVVLNFPPVQIRRLFHYVNLNNTRPVKYKDFKKFATKRLGCNSRYIISWIYGKRENPEIAEIVRDLYAEKRSVAVPSISGKVGIRLEANPILSLNKTANHNNSADIEANPILELGIIGTPNTSGIHVEANPTLNFDSTGSPNNKPTLPADIETESTLKTGNAEAPNNNDTEIKANPTLETDVVESPTPNGNVVESPTSNSNVADQPESIIDSQIPSTSTQTEITVESAASESKLTSECGSQTPKKEWTKLQIVITACTVLLVIVLIALAFFGGRYSASSVNEEASKPVCKIINLNFMNPLYCEEHCTQFDIYHGLCCTVCSK